MRLQIHSFELIFSEQESDRKRLNVKIGSNFNRLVVFIRLNLHFSMIFPIYFQKCIYLILLVSHYNIVSYLIEENH